MAKEGDATSISDSEIDFAFNKYSDSEEIFAFGVKCALLHLFGDEIKEVSLQMCARSLILRFSISQAIQTLLIFLFLSFPRMN